MLWPWPSVHVGQLAPTTLPQCRLVSRRGGGGGVSWGGGRGCQEGGGGLGLGAGGGGLPRRGAGQASYPDKYGIRIGCLTPAFWEADQCAEMLHHPCILGDLQQRGHSQSKKKSEINKNKKFPTVPPVLPTVLQTDPIGV